MQIPRTLALGVALLISSALAGAQTWTTLTNTSPGVPGTWNLNYDWSCSGNYVQDTQTFNPDGTFSDSQGASGKWSSHDGQILFQFNNSSHTAYEGSIVASAIVGISSTFIGQSGCWYAIKTTAAAKPSAEGTQELTISGEPRK